MEMAHVGPTPYQFGKWSYQVFIDIEKYKIGFEISLRIIFLLMAI